MTKEDSLKEIKKQIYKNKLMHCTLLSVLSDKGIISNEELRKKKEHLEKNNLITVEWE